MKLVKPTLFLLCKGSTCITWSGLSDRHIKTPLNCEIEHSVKIDLTFTAYWSLPRAVPKFLDNCFIIGFTYFPVAILTSSEEGVISKSSWQLREKQACFLVIAQCLSIAAASCSINRNQFCASEGWVWAAVIALGWEEEEGEAEREEDIGCLQGLHSTKLCRMQATRLNLKCLLKGTAPRFI